MSDDYADNRPDMTATFPAPDGKYQAECTECRRLPDKDGTIVFKLTWALREAMNPAPDAEPLNPMAETEAFMRFPPKSKDPQAFKRSMQQLQRFCRATGRSAPPDFSDANMPEWHTLFVGAEAVVSLRTSDDRQRQWCNIG